MTATRAPSTMNGVLIKHTCSHITMKCGDNLADNAAMRTLPKDLAALIEFAEAHFPVWDPEPEAIGLTKDQMTVFFEKMKMAREKYDLCLAARAVAVAATTTMRTEVAALRDLSSAYVAAIKAFAKTGGESGLPPGEILAKAQIAPPAAPGTGPRADRQATSLGDAPGQPTGVRAVVASSGAVVLSWRARAAAASTGAFFTVLRKVAGEPEFSILGTVPGLSRTRREARFVDESLPAGVNGAAYIIVGERAGVRGPRSEIAAVSFGGGGGLVSRAA